MSFGFLGAVWGLTGIFSRFNRRILGSNRDLPEASGGEPEPHRSFSGPHRSFSGSLRENRSLTEPFLGSFWDLFGLFWVLPVPPGALKAFNGKNSPGSLPVPSRFPPVLVVSRWNFEAI